VDGLSRVKNCSPSSRIPIPLSHPFSFIIAAEEIAIGNTFATKLSKFGAIPGYTFESPLDSFIGTLVSRTATRRSRPSEVFRGLQS
jgi:hypothetical protein